MNDQEMLKETKGKIKIICQNKYDRDWLSKITESPKAISYCKIKYNVSLENYHYEVKNIIHKIALSRLRLSNHSLLIETGRHLRPKLERHERKCFVCKDDIEDECHFVTKCPLYSSERNVLYNSLKGNSKFFESLNEEQKFVFIMTNENKMVMRELENLHLSLWKLEKKQLKLEIYRMSLCGRSYLFSVISSIIKLQILGSVCLVSMYVSVHVMSIS